MKILLIEDDLEFIAVLQQALMSHNYRIEIASDGQTGLELATAFNYDLILLDIILPKIDGISITKQLRSLSYQMPILIMTGQGSPNVHVAALNGGADDYIMKPFTLPELIARIQALLRRSRVILPAVLVWENLQLDTTNRVVIYRGKYLHLTPKEYDLLELFLRNPRKIFTRSELLNRIWFCAEAPGEEAVTAHIKGLRKKLKTAGMTANLIETIYGLGYRLKESGQKLTKPHPPLHILKSDIVST
ncbi:response regulator transcription factor [Aetokthonos hydrillicola Thurmond2011]|jgi:DNA-binding response OmpR family regulator|uniref:Response regulator transcription factor n=1 Tax=Aetokthonos hydrillicola Thurmond2011 TaxID=2712845 RepID=A0AAP5IBL2_9CYAN|nr:response regulator transcription factor [Aetokthonos hydrillicola]MBO3462451.1 response regulator transcription factor [Aetokthonos hydrillicola CCALA 1050]MBW4589856.1 response regulator transcription factor [Aetokthonos hydrillicola CCALA 1050]MDR9898426.1 response regulator transcription factor [Aetokthonos hydrillicola Thurmond2011]